MTGTPVAVVGEEKEPPVEVQVTPVGSLVVAVMFRVWVVVRAARSGETETVNVPRPVMVRVRVADLVRAGTAESVTRKVKGVLVTGVLGVPVIAPVAELRVRPVGNVPPVSFHVYGVVPPVAASVAL